MAKRRSGFDSHASFRQYIGLSRSSSALTQCLPAPRVGQVYPHRIATSEAGGRVPSACSRRMPSTGAASPASSTDRGFPVPLKAMSSMIRTVRAPCGYASAASSDTPRLYRPLGVVIMPVSPSIETRCASMGHSRPFSLRNLDQCSYCGTRGSGAPAPNSSTAGSLPVHLISRALYSTSRMTSVRSADQMNPTRPALHAPV